MCGYGYRGQRNPIDSRKSMGIALGLLVLCNLTPGASYRVSVGEWSEVVEADAAGSVSVTVPDSGTLVLEREHEGPQANGCGAEGRE